MECEGVFIFLCGWLHQKQMTVVNYFKEHGTTEIERCLDFE